jgi:hypothetical protein
VIGLKEKKVPSFYCLHDELICWLVENVPQHYVQGTPEHVQIDIWDNLELVREFQRAAICLRVMDASMLGNSWVKMSELARHVEEKRDE